VSPVQHPYLLRCLVCNVAMGADKVTLSPISGSPLLALRRRTLARDEPVVALPPN
jgi:hypothetical protein